MFIDSDPGSPAGMKPSRPFPSGYACCITSEVLAGEFDHSRFAVVELHSAAIIITILAGISVDRGPIAGLSWGN